MGVDDGGNALPKPQPTPSDGGLLPSKDVAVRDSLPTSEEGGFEAVLTGFRDKCEATAGRWHHGLFQCRCEAGKIFFEDNGCAEMKETLFSWHAKANPRKEDVETTIKSQDSSNIEISVDTFGLSQDRSADLASFVESEPYAIYDGLIVPASHHKSLSVIISEPKFQGFIYSFLPARNRGNRHLSSVTYQYITVDGLLPTSTTPFTPGNCASAVKKAFEDTKSDDVEDTCQRLHAELQEMLAPRPRGYQFTDPGEACEDGCVYSSGRSNRGFGSYTTIFLQRYLPVSRSVLAYGPAGHKAYAIVSPLGKLEALVWVWEHVIKKADQELRDSTQVVYLDANLLPFAARNDDADAPRPVSPSYSPGMPERPQASSTMRAVVTEAAISPTISTVWSRYNREMSVRANTLLGEWISDASNERPSAEISAALATEWPAGDLTHGDTVAACLLRDLPNSELMSMSAESLYIYGSPSIAVNRWIDILTQYRPAVVNISQMFPTGGMSCEDFIGRLFRALPDTLFVVGVGNSGQRQGQNWCPTNIWRNHPNILTVAATDATGGLASYSNRGPNMAMVAAPGDAEITFDEEGHEKTKRIGGTSIAAPHVGNIALKMLAHEPWLKPPEIIARLREACSTSGLDVDCGGSLSEQSLIEKGWNL